MAKDLEITARLEWNKPVLRGLELVGDKGMYMIARETLDRNNSSEITPWNTGKMARSAMSGGVKGSNGNYYIGNYTDYASSVWKMTNVNWTNPKSENQWFMRTLQRNQVSIVDNALKKYWQGML